MLKLEKVAKTMEISIALRQRDHRFNRTFAISLLIAIALHAMAALLFQIRPFKIVGSQVVFPLTMVDTEIASDNSIVVAEWEGEDIVPQRLRRPRGAIAKVSPLAPIEFPVKPETIFKRTTPSEARAFERLEKDVLSLQNAFLEGPRIKESGIKVVLSGPLEGKTILLEPEYNLQENILPCQCSAVFQIQIEQQSGIIFWYAPLQLTSNPALDAFAEHILKQIRFSSEQTGFVSSGEIAIEFHFPEGYS
jgi:hypothetical protein